jgi:signal transduction histidine kinase
MSTLTRSRSYEILAVRFALGVLLVLALSMAIFYAMMQPSSTDFLLMGVFLSITAVISVTVGYGVYRLGWLEQLPSIRWSLLVGYAIASLLTFVNVWLTARLMFANDHDLTLATILLLFAGGIAIALGGFFSSALAERIHRLEEAALSVARGRLETRLQVRGKDELASLGATFNQMAEELQASQQKQRQLDALRRDLIAWVSHDLQTPLASMRLVVEALADGVVEDPATVQRYLRSAQKDIRSLSILIDDLFHLAQLDAGGLSLEFEYGSLADLISDTLESFSGLAQGQGVDLQGALDAGVDPAWMDTGQVGRVLSNLVGNALRHTPPGGEVRVAARRQAGAVLVEVCDNGEGIPPQDLPLVFDRFYRGEKSRSRETGGSGLGLAIARGVVRAHGGEIAVESRPGELTRFTFSLPDKP